MFSRLSTTALSLMAVLDGASAAADSRHLRAGATPTIDLGVAGNFAILSASGITDVYPSAITGDVGTSPITGAALLLACDEVTGNIYTVDAAGPACKTTSSSMLTTAIGDMGAAYDQAAGVNNPDYLDLGAGLIGGMTLSPGVYKWTSSVLIASDIYLQGTVAGSLLGTDRWLFQVDGNLDQSSAVQVHLSVGAVPEKIVWQVAGTATLGTTSHSEGVFLGKTGIDLRTGSSVNGRLLAQTAVTLQMNTVVEPAN